jgi:hypothetical protein
VASGLYSFISGGENSTASGSSSGIICAIESIASASGAIVLGGILSEATGDYSICLGGVETRASLIGEIASGMSPETQHTISLRAFAETTNATPTEMSLVTAAVERITIPAGQTWGFVVNVVGRQSGGTNKAFYTKKGLISNTGGTTALDAAIQSLGTDIETNAAWDCVITADNANSALVITVTGAAATNIRWLATLDITQVTYT